MIKYIFYFNITKSSILHNYIIVFMKKLIVYYFSILLEKKAK